MCWNDNWKQYKLQNDGYNVWQNSRIYGFIKEKFGQEEINKALLGQNNAITFMATFYPTINEFRGNIDLQ